VVYGRRQFVKNPVTGARVPRPGNEQIEHADETLRIIPRGLWDAVKLRQAQQRTVLGARVRGALRRNSAGQGRAPRHLLSGLLRCGVCDARFTVADARAYACASYLNGHACSNNIRVRRRWAEERILDSVKADLRDPAVVTEIERRMARAMAAEKPKAASGQRIADLQRQIGNLTDAIASGALKGSPALATRLADAEAELQRLQAEQSRAVPAVACIAPKVAERYLEIVGRLEEHMGRNTEHSRPALVQAIGDRITLTPDKSGKFLWAEYGLETAPMLVALGVPEIMVAGACYAMSRRPFQAKPDCVSAS
jgi:site-specific DNA recombinase